MNMAVRRERILLKVEYPLWFRLLYGIGGPIVLLSICITLFRVGRGGLSSFAIAKGGFLLLVVGLGFWVVPRFFSTIYVKDSGIEELKLWGANEKLTWDEIGTVARPRLGIPYDAAYIVSKEGKRITLARSMNGFSELLRLIETKAPNLTPKQLSENLWPSTPAKAWRQILIALGLFIAYVVVRKVMGW
jgi:hypothetical protein